MATTLVDDLTGLFRSQVLGEAVANLHESEGSIMRGFQTASAAILGGLAGKAGEPGFLRQAYDMITSSFGDGKILDSLGGLFRSSASGAPVDSTSNRFLSMLFGSEQGNVTEKISQASGLRVESASKLLSFAAPVVMGMLGKRAQESHLDAAGFSNMLQRERAGLSGMLPAGLSSLLTLPTVKAYDNDTISRPSSNRWLWPVLLLLALFAILWIWARPRNTVTEVASNASNAVTSTAARVGEMVKATLANGVELNIPSIGLENNLLTYLRNPVGGVDPNRWFEFDRLTFDTNAATLRPESQEQLSNIAAILKSYPNVNVKIGGYTDNTGDPAANMSLSQKRAESVREQLVALGVASNRLEAEGYGSQHPVADNSTEEGRAKNRRIAMRITAL